MAFDYDNTTVASAEDIEAVVAEISGGGLKPLSDEEREARRIEHEHFLAESRERDRQLRLEYERRQAELRIAEQTQIDRQNAIARAERTERLRADMQQQSNRQMRDRQLSDLHQASIRNEAFRNAALRSAAHANARQRLKSALNPPEQTTLLMPAPEAEQFDRDSVGSPYRFAPNYNPNYFRDRSRF